MKKEIKVYLLDIIASIELIEKYTTGMSFEDFTEDPRAQDSVCMRLAVIGESVNNLSDEEKQKNPLIPWSQIVGMRNLLVHNYGSVAWKRIWQTVQHDLPPLKKEVQKILENQAD